MTDLQTTNRQHASALRKIADTIEITDSLPWDLWTDFWLFLKPEAFSKEDMGLIIQQLTMLLGKPKVAKDADYGSIDSKWELSPKGPGINVICKGNCKRVQVGTRLVEEKPAVPAIPAHEEPVYELECE